MNIYEREFSVAAGTELVMPAGETAMCFEIGFPPEGEITKLIVKQAADDLGQVAFRVNLYDRQVCELGPTSSESASVDTTTKAIAKIIPTTPVAGWNTAGEELFINDKNYGYRNREGTWTVPVRKVYLEILVQDDSAETNWEVAIAAITGGAAT